MSDTFDEQRKQAEELWRQFRYAILTDRNTMIEDYEVEDMGLYEETYDILGLPKAEIADVEEKLSEYFDEEEDAYVVACPFLDSTSCRYVLQEEEEDGVPLMVTAVAAHILAFHKEKLS